MVAWCRTRPSSRRRSRTQGYTERASCRFRDGSPSSHDPGYQPLAHAHGSEKSTRVSGVVQAALDPAAQHFGNAPGLGNAATWSVGRLSVEDLADGSDASVRQMALETIEKLARAFEIAGTNLEPGVDKRPDEPRPDRALVIGAVADPKVTVVLGLVVFVIGR